MHVSADPTDITHDTEHERRKSYSSHLLCFSSPEINTFKLEWNPTLRRRNALQPQTYLLRQGLSHLLPLSVLWHHTPNADAQKGSIFTLQELVQQIINSRQEPLQAENNRELSCCRDAGTDLSTWHTENATQGTGYLSRTTDRAHAGGLSAPPLPPHTGQQGTQARVHDSKLSATSTSARRGPDHVRPDLLRCSSLVPQGARGGQKTTCLNPRPPDALARFSLLWVDLGRAVKCTAIQTP